jgi:cyclic pyranopterin phosphate synthase
MSAPLTSMGLTHVDARGQARMVDVSGKAVTRRRAEARCRVRTGLDAAAVVAGASEDADLVESARMSGLLAGKKTSSLIPLCHPIRVDRLTVDILVGDGGFDVIAVAEIDERTGVEMEALTACAGAALVLVAACAVDDPSATIEGLALWSKSGGRSGDWRRTATGDVEHTGPRAPETRLDGHPAPSSATGGEGARLRRR